MEKEHGASMKNAIFRLLAAALSMTLLVGCAKLGGPELINVSYDPTREFYEAYNALFVEHWEEETGKHLQVIQSHGGSGAQALAVSQGLPADVVTLALESDVQELENQGLLDAGWIDEFPNDSAPYTSTIVFLVRRGNPKNIQDWGDLAADGVGVITPNPKTSGGARWNFLAAWAWAQQQFPEDENRVRAYIYALFRNVLVLDSGARSATTSFVENHQGDVLITWENEGYFAMEEYPGEYELICPSVSILCQPTVAVVDEVTRVNGTKRLATAYLDFLYSEEAQHLAADYYYRPTDPAILAQYTDRFDLDVELLTIDDFGGWEAAQEKFFADGAEFDMIYENMEIVD